MPDSSVAFDKRTLRERCTSFVRDQIITGALRPGDHLIETKLSSQLGVSRGTLREALRPLENEGLLVDDGRGHVRVREITPGEIGDVFAVRAALESLAVTVLTQREDREAVSEQLRKALEPLRDETLDIATQLRIDLGFHELLCKLTGNETLLRSWRQLISQIERIIIAAGPAAAGRMRYEDHATIAAAIASGDPREAADVMEQHMADFASRYLGDHDE